MKKFNKLKKISNYLWFIGTILIVLLCTLSLIMTLRSNYNNDKYESIMNELSIYNAEHFGYSEKVDVAESILDIKPAVNDELANTMSSIDCESINVTDTFTLVGLSVIEPTDEIKDVVASINNNADFWIIIKDGMKYYGDQSTDTLDIQNVDIIQYNSENVDDFLNNMKTEMFKQRNSLTVFIDVNYGLVPIPVCFYNKFYEVFNELDDTDSLMFMLQYLDEVGEHTSKMDNIFELYNSLK